MNSTLSGLEALKRGDAALAKSFLQHAVAVAPVGERPWLALFEACRQTRDEDGCTSALEGLLRDEPRNLAGLLLTGLRKQESGDDRSAQAFFTAALRQASTVPPPQDLHGLLSHAQTFVKAAQQRFERQLLDYVTPAPPNANSISRFERAVDLLLGRRELHLSQPSMLYYPGLPQQPFFERHLFPWARELEAATDAIRSEMLALTEEFAPYVAGHPNRPRPIANPLLDDPSWGAFYLWRAGAPAEDAWRCPKTMQALDRVPLPQISNQSPNVLFSRLKPGAHIRPHFGLLNTRLICHLPLVVPKECSIRVGDETREWKEGQLLIFDDSFEHEAWNRGEGTRTVLIFEVWRPELDAQERANLTNLFQAIQQYGGAPIDQG
jgi:aspartyl/asparaginyl beta-hydroxylase (cupin superfamily)